MTTITLRPITPDNWVECIDLTPTAEQQIRGYVAANLLSLAQAYAERWWTPLAVYADETMVGFILYGRWPDQEFSAMWGDKPKPGIDYILRMMIDQRYQGQSYGRAALTLLIDRIKAQPGCRAIELDYDRDNIGAARLYPGCGFQSIEENEAGEVVARFVVDDGLRSTNSAKLSERPEDGTSNGIVSPQVN
jgi:diamine N-acetyltransferase